MRADALPKGREIPIRGDVVRTLRIQGGWDQPEDFASDVGLSLDTIKAIEKGGKRVFGKNILKIAKTLHVEWQSLVDWSALEPDAAPADVEADRPARGKHRISVTNSGTSAATNGSVIQQLFDEAAKIAGQNGTIKAIALDDSGATVTLEFSDEAVLAFVSNYCGARMEGAEISSARVHLDVRLLGGGRESTGPVAGGVIRAPWHAVIRYYIKRFLFNENNDLLTKSYAQYHLDFCDRLGSICDKQGELNFSRETDGIGFRLNDYTESIRTHYLALKQSRSKLH